MTPTVRPGSVSNVIMKPQNVFGAGGGGWLREYSASKDVAGYQRANRPGLVEF